MTTSTPAPAPQTYAEARVNADAVQLVMALRAGIPNHDVAGMIRRASSPHQAITLRLAEMVAALGSGLAESHNADPAEAFAEWSAAAFDIAEQFDAADNADEGGGDQ